MPVRHRGYGAYISCDGKELQAYKVKMENNKITSCYIQSEVDKEFRVHWLDSKPPSHLSIEIRMDGRKMGVISHEKHAAKTSNGGFRIAIDAQCPYQFSPSSITDDDDVLPTAYNEELGVIELRLRRAQGFITLPFKPKTPSVHQTARTNERNRKGKGPSHCISLGNKREVKANSTILRPLLIDENPYVIFRFLYRPREYLESKGIIPGPGYASSRASSIASSSISSASRRKRSSSESTSSLEMSSPSYKRQRTSFEDNASRDDTPMSLSNDGDEKENVVEVHLHSANNFAITGSGANESQVKRELSLDRELSPLDPIKREPTPVNVPREPAIKREPSPVTEIRLSSKNNYTIPGASLSSVRVKEEVHVKLEPAADSDVAESVYDEGRELPAIMKRELDDAPDDDDDEHVVEIHLSSRDCRDGTAGKHVDVTKREPTPYVKQETEL